jgi:predicted dehydrogenase
MNQAIVIAGAGLIGRKHIEIAARNPKTFRLAAIADPAASAGDIAKRYDVPHFDDFETALEAVKPDGAVIASPNGLHAEQAIACIRRGIPVLVEKPVADTMANAQNIVEAAERANVPVLVGHHRRHMPVLQKAKEIISSGKLGRLTAVMASALLRKPDRYFEDAPWRKSQGGGPLLINLIHDIDNLRYLCGDITEVQAFSSNAARKFSVEDTAAVSLRFANGALGTYILSDIAGAPRSWDQSAGEKNSFHYYPQEECYLIAGDRGSLSVPTLRVAEHLGTPDWSQPLSFSTEPVEHPDPHEMQLMHFADVMAGRAKPLVSARDAMRTLELTLATARAAKTGLPVSV